MQQFLYFLIKPKIIFILRNEVQSFHRYLKNLYYPKYLLNILRIQLYYYPNNSLKDLFLIHLIHKLIFYCFKLIILPDLANLTLNM
jgi:hypothetical protein